MAAPQQGGGQDNSFGILWGVAAIFAALGGIWFAFKTQIITFYLTIKLYEVHLLNALFNDKYVSLNSLIVTAIANSKRLTFSDLLMLGDGVGNLIKYPLIIIMLILAFVVYFGNSTHLFKRTYSMKDLTKLEKDNWPQITPVVGLDLIKTDIDVGPWAMALTPMQFCKRNQLLEEIRPQRHEGMSRKDWDKIDVVLKRGEANRIFALQLGQLWGGLDKLPPYARALFAVFAARINADSKEAANVLARLSASCMNTELDMTGVNELLKKHAKTKLVEKIVSEHAYVATVMASMLEGARTDGVQASADFLWLKIRDRRLWYVLNTVGRQTPFTEVAGIFAHWKAEKEAARRLFVPMVEEATRALELALKEVVYRPDEK